MGNKYDHKEIEKKWQEKWKEEKLYETKDKVESKENFYNLFEFPYPSGNLHIGHWYAFAVPDIFARAKRMQGYNVMFPIGFDAFGLPAENAAIKRGLDPKKWTYENIAYMENQLQSMGGSFDWSRKVVTADPEYYKWTQWLFLQFYEKGLAYKKKALVNWCPKDQTVLANEQVAAGKCERCGAEVVQKDLEQWFFKITDYAERLISDLEPLKWPEPIKDAQRNWIGKSEGASLKFQITNSKLQIEVFTTRADTLFGATYLVVAPEHEWLQREISNNKSQITNKSEILNYASQTKNKTEIERTDAKKEKTGVELKGIMALNPATNEEIPIWIADYVLGNYGTGAVMAVPAHDERDWEFAKKYGLPIKQVVAKFSTAGNGEKDAVREDKKTVKRKTAYALVWDRQSNKFLCLDWNEHGWHSGIIGGVDENETYEEAALREIKEETGYVNLKFVRELGGEQHSHFFAAHKDENRYAFGKGMLFEIIDGKKAPVSAEHTKNHKPVWIDESEMKNWLNLSAFQRMWEVYKSGLDCFADDGLLINSGEFDGMKSEEAREKIAEKFGKKVTKYKLRDWLLSRQRYWGCPIPIVYDPEGKPHSIPEEHLPWKLPEDDIDFTPKGASPLASSEELRQRTEKIFGKGWKPECDTMDTFVDSSWYFLRYCDSKNDKEFASKEKMESWMPVKKYSGGAEHTTMHLLYSRFFHKALFDMGFVREPEPFSERMNRGLILGPDGQKMSKSKGNVIDPDEQVERMGADTMRIYLAFIGPYNEVGQYPWDVGGVVGTRRFLEKVWRISLKLKADSLQEKTENQKFQAPSSKLLAFLHKTIKKVTEDIESFKFNTAISAMMIFVNELDHTLEISKGTFETFLKLLAPFAPHMTEELWRRLGHEKSIHLDEWPKWDEDKIKEEKVIMVIQINGKVRGQFEADSDINEAEAREKALQMPEINKWLDGMEIKKTIFVPKKILNLVI